MSLAVGIFSVGDVTRNPVTGRTPSEGERIEAFIKIANRYEQPWGSGEA